MRMNRSHQRPLPDGVLQMVKGTRRQTHSCSVRSTYTAKETDCNTYVHVCVTKDSGASK